MSPVLSRAFGFLRGQVLRDTESSLRCEQAQITPVIPLKTREQVPGTHRLLSKVRGPAGRQRTEREMHHPAWVCRVPHSAPSPEP